MFMARGMNLLSRHLCNLLVELVVIAGALSGESILLKQADHPRHKCLQPREYLGKRR